MLTRYEVHPLDYRFKDELAAVEEAASKFAALDHIFWIRLSDLIDIVPRHPHLSGKNLRCRPLALDNNAGLKTGREELRGAGSPTFLQTFPSLASATGHPTSLRVPNGADINPGSPSLPNGIH